MPDYTLSRPARTPYIRSAAIRQAGRVWEGAHHCQIIGRIWDHTGKPVTGEQGFVTSDGRFVDRVEAGRIAIKARQILTLTHHQEDLFSEELWRWPTGTSPWISVKECLPDGPLTVVLVTNGIYYGIGLHSGSGWLEIQPFIGKPPTHWMPLPPIPSADPL